MVEEKISDSKTRMQADAALLKKDVSNLNAADVNEAFDLFEGQRLSIEALDDFENSVNELIGCKLERTVELLGEEYDLSDTTTQRQIVKDVNAAEHFLQPIEISNRQGMQHWMELSAVSEDTINSCNQAIDDILNEAEELAEIQTAPDRTRRIQLYARVANWLTDNAQVLGEQCPVCGQNIEGRIDSVTGEEVQSHIQECCMANSEAWSKAPQHWAKEQIGKLNTSIPAVLRRETVGNPRMQLGEAMVKEVSNSSCFQGALHALAAKLSENWAEIHENYTDKLPELTLQTPEILLENCSELWDLIKRIKTRIQIVQFIQNSGWDPQELERELERELLGDEEAGDNVADSIRQAVDTLHSIAATTEPLSKLFEYTARMRKELILQSKHETEVDQYNKAVDALGPLETLK